MKSPLAAFGLAVMGFLAQAPSLSAATPRPVHDKNITEDHSCVDAAPSVAAAAVCPKLKGKLKGKGKVKAKPKLPPLPVPVNPSPEAVYKFMTETSAVDPVLVLSIVATESSFHSIARAVGQGVGHYGLMQIAYATARGVGFRGKAQELYNWQVNVKFGARYIAYLQHRYPGQRDAVIAAYNAGAAFYKTTKKHGKRLVNQGYVNRVNSFYAVFSRRFKGADMVADEHGKPEKPDLEPVNH